MTYYNRRRFLKAGSALGFAGTTGLLSSLTSQTANAANTTGYKALVCLFFKGGMDAMDTVLPTDAASHAALAAARTDLFSGYNVGSGASSRDIINIAALAPDNASDFGTRTFGLPPQMSGMASMFNAGDMAIVGNVGPINEPTNRTSFESGSVQLPARLFSHNDQQSTWLSSGPEGTQTGWGGRFANAVNASNAGGNPVFTSISTAGNDVFLAGGTPAFVAPSGGPQTVDIVDRNNRLGFGSNADDARAIFEDHLKSLGESSSNLYSQDIININKAAITNARAYSDAITGGTGSTVTFPSSGLGGQLKTVADTIGVRGTLSASRQIFYVAIGGFDTHDSQANGLPGLHTQISEAIVAFKASMVALNLWNDVTVFTASDFGRTLFDNGDGTDHGWGGHHFVAGGSVNGKNIYGALPPVDPTDLAYTAGRGRLIPSVSVDQYAATLGSWFGLTDGELDAGLPNLSNFTNKNLGFV